MKINLTDQETLNKFYKTKVIKIGNKIYARCHSCGQVVRLNKPIIGSLHVCK